MRKYNTQAKGDRRRRRARRVGRGPKRTKQGTFPGGGHTKILLQFDNEIDYFNFKNYIILGGKT